MTPLIEKVTLKTQVDEVQSSTRAEQRLEDERVFNMLKNRQLKDAEEVAAGLRSPWSLVAFPKGFTKNCQFTESPNSEFNCEGEAW